MDVKEIKQITKDLKNKYPEIGLEKIEVNEDGGKTSFFMRPTEKTLASLPQEQASIIKRDSISRTTLDLIKPDVLTRSATDIFKTSMEYYFTKDIYGSHIDILSNFACKGFENDIDDKDIKQFYDVWCFDVDFRRMIEWIFLDFFRVGMVRSYKVVSKYEPRVSYLSPTPGKKIKKFNKKAVGAKKKQWSKSFIPVAYTVLNPLMIEIKGSLLFNNEEVYLKPSEDLKKLLKKTDATDADKAIIKALPNEFKSAVESGEDILLDPLLVGAIDYRKMPYERYPKPRGVKAFTAIEYKDALREADLSTLDGITNYILKVTVGNDSFPITSPEQLKSVAELFNTSSKSFDVVYNHTLEIEKIVSPEIDKILGQDKYRQVNDDITGGLGCSRAIIDGKGDMNAEEVELVVKTILEEINYARRQVTRWIYGEYRQIAEALNFDRFPRVRWDDTILRDIILYLSTISHLVDRRMLSYRTALERLGFDYDNEHANMEEELPSVMDGVLGIVGSPFQRSAVQTTQKAPKGTPSYGRPAGKASASIDLDVVKDMTDAEYDAFMNEVNNMRKRS